MKRKYWVMAGLFVALQAVLLVMYVCFLRPLPEPPPEPQLTVLTVTEVYYGSIIGCGLVQAPDVAEQILHGVDRLEYYNDDDRNIAGGGGLILTIYRDGGAEIYTFTGGYLVKDAQDENLSNWYTHEATPDLYNLLDSCIQQRYEYPDF